MEQEVEPNKLEDQQMEQEVAELEGQNLDSKVAQKQETDTKEAKQNDLESPTQIENKSNQEELTMKENQEVEMQCEQEKQIQQETQQQENHEDIDKENKNQEIQQNIQAEIEIHLSEKNEEEACEEEQDEDDEEEEEQNNQNEEQEEEGEEEEQEEEEEEEEDEEEDSNISIPPTPTSISGSYLDWDQLKRENLLAQEEDYVQEENKRSNRTGKIQNNGKGNKGEIKGRRMGKATGGTSGNKKQKQQQIQKQQQTQLKGNQKVSKKKNQKSQKNQKQPGSLKQNNNSAKSNLKTAKKQQIQQSKAVLQKQSKKIRRFNSKGKETTSVTSKQSLKSKKSNSNSSLKPQQQSSVNSKKKATAKKGEQGKGKNQKTKIVSSSKKWAKEEDNQEKHNNNGDESEGENDPDDEILDIEQEKRQSKKKGKKQSQKGNFVSGSQQKQQENEDTSEIDEEQDILFDENIQGMLLEYHTKAPDTLIEFIDQCVIKIDTISALRSQNCEHKLEEFTSLKQQAKSIKNYYSFTDHLGRPVLFVLGKHKPHLRKSSSKNSQQSQQQLNSKQMSCQSQYSEQDSVQNENKGIEKEEEELGQEKEGLGEEKLIEEKIEQEEDEKVKVEEEEEQDNRNQEKNKLQKNTDDSKLEQEDQQKQVDQKQPGEEKEEEEEEEEEEGEEEEDYDLDQLISGDNLDLLEEELQNDQISNNNNNDNVDDNKNSNNEEKTEKKKRIDISELKRKVFKKQEYKTIRIIQKFDYSVEEIRVIKKTSCHSIDYLRDMGLNNMFPRFEDFDRKLRKLFVYTILQRCNSLYSYVYMLQIFEQYEALAKKESISKKYQQVKIDDLKKLFKEDKQNKIITKEWPIIPQTKRDYLSINQYAPVPNSRSNEIFEKMASKKVPVSCPANCACQNLNYSKLSDFSLDEGNWISECPNRKNRIECESCNGCTNQWSRFGKEKQLQRDVSEQLCWGIDLYTRKNIYYLLPELAKIEDKTYFMEETLLKAANLIRVDGWNIQLVLQFIIANSQPKSARPEFLKEDTESEDSEEEDDTDGDDDGEDNDASDSENKTELQKKDGINDNENLKKKKENHSENEIESVKQFKNIRKINKKSNQKEKKQQQEIIEQKEKENLKEEEEEDKYLFSKQDRKFAKLLQKIVNLNVDLEAFRLHTKGVGVVCINPKGIQKNEFITKYIGEIYPSWRWIERQDLMRKQILQSQQKDFLPDFYNIMLETHKDDPKGFDLLFVDPISKGNYSSRFSHSCDPNCLNVSTVSQGSYIIGMFAMKNISYGQELSWDYNSITESKQEHNKAYCLCGQMRCRGKYLALNKNTQKESNQVFDKIHCFLKRNCVILNACQNLELTKEDENIFEEFQFRENILENTPSWLQKWMSKILQVIKEENKLYYEKLMSEQKNNAPQHYKTFCVNQAWSRMENRVHNLVQTVDRVKYIIKSSSNYNAPVRNLNAEQVYGYLFGNYMDQDYFNLQTEKGHDRSVMGSLVDICKSYHAIDQCRTILEYIDKLKIIFHSKSEQFEWKNRVIRLFFLRISHLLRGIQDTFFHYQGLQLIVYFYEFTHLFFNTYDYATVTSEKIQLKNTELFNSEILHNPQNNKLKDIEENKSYGPQFILGQLLIWFKQTCQSPNQNFYQEKRGALLYPNLKCFDTTLLNWPTDKKGNNNNNNGKQQQSPDNNMNTSEVLQMLKLNNNNSSNKSDSEKTIPQQGPEARKQFLEKLKNSPKFEWNTDACKWTFKTQLKIYGSMFLDSYFFQDKFSNDNNNNDIFSRRVLENVDAEFSKKYQVFKDVEKKIYGVSDKEIDDIWAILKNIENKQLEQPLNLPDKVEMDVVNYKLATSKEQIKLFLEIYEQKYLEKMQKSGNNQQNIQQNVLSQQNMTSLQNVDDGTGLLLPQQMQLQQQLQQLQQQVSLQQQCLSPQLKSSHYRKKKQKYSFSIEEDSRQDNSTKISLVAELTPQKKNSQTNSTVNEAYPQQQQPQQQIKQQQLFTNSVGEGFINSNMNFLQQLQQPLAQQQQLQQQQQQQQQGEGLQQLSPYNIQEQLSSGKKKRGGRKKKDSFEEHFKEDQQVLNYKIKKKVKLQKETEIIVESSNNYNNNNTSTIGTNNTTLVNQNATLPQSQSNFSDQFQSQYSNNNNNNNNHNNMVMTQSQQKIFQSNNNNNNNQNSYKPNFASPYAQQQQSSQQQYYYGNYNNNRNNFINTTSTTTTNNNNNNNMLMRQQQQFHQSQRNQYPNNNNNNMNSMGVNKQQFQNQNLQQQYNNNKYGGFDKFNQQQQQPQQQYYNNNNNNNYNDKTNISSNNQNIIQPNYQLPQNSNLSMPPQYQQYNSYNQQQHHQQQQQYHNNMNNNNNKMISEINNTEVQNRLGSYKNNKNQETMLNDNGDIDEDLKDISDEFLDQLQDDIQDLDNNHQIDNDQHQQQQYQDVPDFINDSSAHNSNKNVKQIDADDMVDY